MKKLARLTALLLTGALLLVLTACGAETEQQAKQRLLDEINSYGKRDLGAFQCGAVLGRNVPQSRGLQGSDKRI